jgi:hypothetical protein
MGGRPRGRVRDRDGRSHRWEGYLPVGSAALAVWAAFAGERERADHAARSPGQAPRRDSPFVTVFDTEERPRDGARGQGRVGPSRLCAAPLRPVPDTNARPPTAGDEPGRVIGYVV